MKKGISLLALYSILYLFVVPLAAQVPSRPKIVGTDTIACPASILEKLSNDYCSGQWGDLQTKTDNLLQGQKIGNHTIDSKKNFYLIIFLSREDEEPRLIRFPWHKPEPDRYTSRIPGLNEIFEIVLSEKGELAVKTSYLSTELENPLLSQIPKFVKTIEPALLTFPEKGLKTRPVPAINVEIRSITLPFKRAKIKVNDAAALSDVALSNKIQTAAAELAEHLSLRMAYHSDYGKKIISAVCRRMNEVSVANEKRGLVEKMREAVKAEYSCHIKKYPPKPEELKLAMNIEEEFLGMIEETGAKETKAEFVYENVPLERLSFGLISTFLFENSFTSGRVKVTDAGYYASDPPKNPLTAAIVNFHPSQYDPKSAKMKFSEMFRLFGGFVLTPDVGFCAGAGFSCLRGLSFNVGGALVGIQTKNNPDAALVDGKQFEKPRDPDHPFKMKWGPMFFLGFGYDFQ
jgi:hypothetical protein